MKKKTSRPKPRCREDELSAAAQLLLNALRELISKTGQNEFTDDELLTYINTNMAKNPKWVGLYARACIEEANG